MALFRRELRACMVCSARYATGEAVVSTVENPKTTMAWGMCPTHEALHKKDLVAMVEIDPDKSLGTNDTELMPWNVHRTGLVAYISRSIYRQIVEGEPPENGVAFVSPAFIATLQLLKKRWEGTQTQ